MRRLTMIVPVVLVLLAACDGCSPDQGSNHGATDDASVDMVDDVEDDSDSADPDTTDSGDAPDTDGGNANEDEPPWGEIDDECPPENLTETPYAVASSQTAALGEPGVLWTTDPSCPGSSDPRELDQDAYGGGFLYGVIDWDGTATEVILNVNDVTNPYMFQNPIRSVSVLDATSGERLACLDLEGPFRIQSGRAVFLGDPPRLYIPYSGPENVSDPLAPMGVGVLAVEIAPDQEDPIEFEHVWNTTRSDASSVSVLLKPGGLLGITVTGNMPGTGFLVTNATSGEIYWDQPLPGVPVFGIPDEGFAFGKYDVDTSSPEYSIFDRCGEQVRTTSHLGVPLGDYWVSEEALGSEISVVIRDATGAKTLSATCSRPVAVDEKTVACVERIKDNLKILDLGAMTTTEFELPKINEATGEEQSFQRQAIALEGRKVLIHVAVLSEQSSYFYVYDIPTGELTLDQIVEGRGISFNRAWAMSRRGVIYGAQAPHISSTVSAVAIQTNVRPAKSPWPFGLPTRPRAGNDNRGWLR
ncbi:MAG: hypothetical protein ACQEVA_21365 [Myxococcota bacterium]